MAIYRLEEHVADLIAAGEVVERPASVVKELCENAIDAGATSITVEIARGGIDYICVSDDGAGIEKADIALAFTRHATSKLRTAQDLDHILTLGFRGEALASIASVAKVELLTKNDADEDASLFIIAGGKPGEILSAARGRGTTFIVRDLFYNTPARMKFLKKDTSEGTFVTETISRLALSHPEVAVRYIRDAKPVFSTPGDGDIHATVYTVLGRQFAHELVKVSASAGPYRVEGFVTPPRAGRPSRSMQFFFINGRFVKNRTMMAALEQAYKGMSMQGRFPGGVLFLHMPHEWVDVNVHPAKTEVRFSNEQEVFTACYRAVKAALLDASAAHSQFSFSAKADEGKAVSSSVSQSDDVQPTMSEKTTVPKTINPVPEVKKIAPGRIAAYNQMTRELAQEGILASEASAVPYVTRPKPLAVPFLRQAEGLRQEQKTCLLTENTLPECKTVQKPVTTPQPKAEKAPEVLEQEPLSPERELPDADVQQQTLLEEMQASAIRLVGELFKTYIVAEYQNALCLIDKHAAHERILYERIAADRTGVPAQQLLSPVSVSLSAEEKNALLAQPKVLCNAGIELEDFGGNTVLVRAVPADVQPDDIEALVVEVAGRLAVNNKDSLNEKTEWVMHSMACRAAVKAGDKTHPQELLTLAQDILTGKVPPFCPHGRPVVLEISRKELEKQFGRLG